MNKNSDIIQYNINFIKKIKDDYKIMPIELENIYKSKYDEIIKSENYKALKKTIGSMIKIKDNVNYSDLDKSMMNIISLLNKLTNDNIENIQENILKIKFNKELLYYFIDNIYLKITTEINYKNSYFSIIKYIINNNNYYINKEINFYTLIIDKIQDNFNNILDNSYIKNLYNNMESDIDNYYKKKKSLIGNIEFIGLLFNNNLISKDIILFILDKLLVNCDIKIEILCSLMTIININNKFNYVINNINNIYKLNNSRIKYLIDNLLKKSKIKNNCKPIINIKITDNMKLNNLINEHLIHKDINESINYLDDFINNYELVLEDFIFILFEKNENEIEILINLLIQIIIKYKKDINLFIDFMLDNLEDFLIDYPFTIKYYQKIFSMFKINKIISYNKYNDLNNKINLNNS